ncbi:hypothetical protein AB6A40_009827 [Gnathostoma spinigerum]|uniref:Uncharacterized protein n=1 Tax=Gnathostoma spinigerum TaxID=75299 RepID=A0ABD6ETH1_9BILA
MQDIIRSRDCDRIEFRKLSSRPGWCCFGRGWCTSASVAHFLRWMFNVEDSAAEPSCGAIPREWQDTKRMNYRTSKLAARIKKDTRFVKGKETDVPKCSVAGLDLLEMGSNGATPKPISSEGFSTVSLDRGNINNEGLFKSDRYCKECFINVPDRSNRNTYFSI